MERADDARDTVLWPVEERAVDGLLVLAVLDRVLLEALVRLALEVVHEGLQRLLEVVHVPLGVLLDGQELLRLAVQEADVLGVGEVAAGRVERAVRARQDDGRPELQTTRRNDASVAVAAGGRRRSRKGKRKEAHLERALEEGLHALREDRVALGVRDEARAGEEHVADGLGGPSGEALGRGERVGEVESCERVVRVSPCAPTSTSKQERDALRVSRGE